MLLGSAWTFASAVLIIVMWGLTGPIFHYSDTWQLIINTGTTIVTFLMVFLIQNTQNRDAKAAHLKLDELIRALKGARNHLIDLEKLADEDLSRLEKQFERVRKKAELNRDNPDGKRRANRAEGETIPLDARPKPCPPRERDLCGVSSTPRCFRSGLSGRIFSRRTKATPASRRSFTSRFRRPNRSCLKWRDHTAGRSIKSRCWICPPLKICCGSHVL